MAYRRDGGQSMIPSAELCALVVQSIMQGDTAEVEQILEQYAGSEGVSLSNAMISKLQAILRGERNPNLSDDPNLEYDDTVQVF
jgi:hypothetical protein